MFVIEIVGPISAGKTSLVHEIRGQLKSAGKVVYFPYELVPIRQLITKTKSEGLRNLLLELYFLVRYPSPIFKKVRSLALAIPFEFRLNEKIKLYRSLIRKTGYDILSKNSSHKEGYLILDEGYYQILQNLVAPESGELKLEPYLSRYFFPDSLIVVTASVENLFSRSKSRKDLTKRYIKLDDRQLYKVLKSSRTAYKSLVKAYAEITKKTVRTLKESEKLSIQQIETFGVVVILND